ncbi:hypothetical protein ACH47Z_39660 [Streptomyces sp. NPDC020192]|uniref:hypothetical protein n=1 Tax=Streptomyces sp. NPDC020192 TaxID=3365066 RepID=UPI0037B17145
MRSLGDVLAWRAFGRNRRILLAWCRNMPPGVMAGKEGLVAELAFVEEQWRDHGRYVLLRDLTNCLRIGDATEWDPDRGGPRIAEIKINPCRKDPRQQRRIDAFHAAVYEGGNLPGDHRDERLHDPSSVDTVQAKSGTAGRFSGSRLCTKTPSAHAPWPTRWWATTGC